MKPGIHPKPFPVPALWAAPGIWILAELAAWDSPETFDLSFEWQFEAPAVGEELLEEHTEYSWHGAEPGSPQVWVQLQNSQTAGNSSRFQCLGTRTFTEQGRQSVGVCHASERGEVGKCWILEWFQVGSCGEQSLVVVAAQPRACPSPGVPGGSSGTWHRPLLCCWLLQRLSIPGCPIPSTWISSAVPHCLPWESLDFSFAGI